MFNIRFGFSCKLSHKSFDLKIQNYKLAPISLKLPDSRDQISPATLEASYQEGKPYGTQKKKARNRFRRFAMELEKPLKGRNSYTAAYISTTNMSGFPSVQSVTFVSV